MTLSSTSTRAATLALAGLALLGAPTSAEEDAGPSAAQLFPENTLVYVEAGGLSKILDAGLEHPLVRAALETELGRVLLAKMPMTPAAGLAFLDAVVGQPVLPALASLCAKDCALGLIPGAGGPEVALVLRAEDAELGRRLLDRLHELAGEKETFAFAQAGDLFVLAKTKKQARKLLARSDANQGLATQSSFAARRAGRDDGILWAWLDLDGIEKLPGAKLEELRANNGNPGFHALLGSQLAALTSAREISAALDFAEPNALSLELVGHGVRTAPALQPKASALLPPLVAPHEDDLASGLVYRDYGALLTEARDLFAPQTLPKLAEAGSNFALFFGGRDVAEEVLPDVSPWLHLVVRKLDFELGPTPEIPLPGLAVVARLDHVEERGPEFQAAFQSLVSIIGLDQARKGSGRPLLLSLATEGDTPVNSAHFLPPGREDGVDMRYNLRPACAVLGHSLVLGTHEELVRELVRELANDRRRETRATSLESLTLHSTAIADVVRANFETLVTNKVLEEGVTHEKAQEELGGLELLLRGLSDAYIEVSAPEKDAVALSLRVALEPQQ